MIGKNIYFDRKIIMLEIRITYVFFNVTASFEDEKEVFVRCRRLNEIERETVKCKRGFQA